MDCVLESTGASVLESASAHNWGDSRINNILADVCIYSEIIYLKVSQPKGLAF